MKRINIFLVACIILFPIIVFYGSFFYYAIDVPINDDYNAILDFLNQYVLLNNLSDKIKLLFSLANEHRIVFDRVCVLLQYKLTGKVNFVTLSLIGNSALLGVFYILYKQFEKIQKPLLYLIPVSLLIFNFHFWENTHFAMATLQNNTVVFFVLCSLYFITTVSYKNYALLFAILFLFLAVFTSGGGVFLAVIGVFYYAHQKQYKSLAIWIIASVFCSFLYFYQYIRPEHIPSSLDTLVDYKVQWISFAFSFLGNIFSYYNTSYSDLNDSLYYTTIIGYTGFLYFLYLVKLSYYRKNPFVFFLMMYIIIIAFVTGLSRCQLGIFMSAASRYRIYGAIFMVLIYYSFLELFYERIKKLSIVFLIFFSLFLIFSSYNQLYFMKDMNRRILDGIMHYNIKNSSHLVGFDTVYMNKILKQSKIQGLYSIPSQEEIINQIPLSNPVKYTKVLFCADSLEQNVETIDSFGSILYFRGWAYKKEQNTFNQKLFIIICSELNSAKYFFPMLSECRPDLNSYFKKTYLEYGGYRCFVEKNKLPKGKSSIFVGVLKNEKIQIIKTDKTIEI